MEMLNTKLKVEELHNKPVEGYMGSDPFTDPFTGNVNVTIKFMSLDSYL